MSEFITKPSSTEEEEPSGSTKIELKVPDDGKTEMMNQITSHIDDIDEIHILHREKIEALRRLFTKEMNEEFNDRDCQRFLIARNYDLTKSFEMMKKRYEWYNSPVTSFKIDNPNLRPKDMGKIPTDNKEEIFSREFKRSNLGEDREGHPIYWEKSGLAGSNWSNIRKYFTHDEMTARHIRQQEMMMERCRLSSIRHGKIIEKQVVIMDLKNVPIFVEWACFKALKEVITIDEAYYPETLKNLFVINAPVYFTALWAIVKPWVDPLTLQKIQICGENFYPILSKYIDDSVIPVEYGGKNEHFSWEAPTNFIME